MFRSEQRDWGLAMMLAHGLGGAIIAAELGELYLLAFYRQELGSELILPMAEHLKSLGIYAVSGFFGGCLASNLIHDSSPYFFWSKPKSENNDSGNLRQDIIRNYR